ncbi:MAG: glycoside hydrolase family 4, partial [Haloarculaceae archaeon]
DEYPGINALGLCHEVLGTRWHLAMLAREELGMDAERADVSVNVKGINHFTWVDEAYCKGVDLWPLLDELKDSERATATFDWEDLADESVFTDNWQVTWELFRRHGVLPAAGDRHIVEYATSFIEGGQETLNRWGVKRTDADYRAKHWTPAESDQTTDVEAWLSGERTFELEASGEEFLPIVEALAGEDTHVTNVNLPNQGQVSDVEDGPVVETNAVVRAGHVKPVSAGGFPRPVRRMVRGHVDTIETVVEAARTGDLGLAFEGFATDDQVQKLSPDDQADLFGELVAAEASFLEDWDLDGARVLDEADTYPE